MAERTLYEVLMLHPTATIEVINAAYRALAKKYHPDHAGPEASEQMAAINEAYTILSDEDKRARYDEIIGKAKDGQAVGHARQSMPGATNLKYEGGAWSVRSSAEPTPASAPFGEAGPPPRFPPASGSILSFGRYRGWSLSQVAAHDRNYLEWLSRTMAGRTYTAELRQVLSQTAN
ncbi:MAG: DnaJ domain-containing protein [Chloroflexota bacterium]|jgi:curved DNA-binding protein CbpA